MAIIKSSNNNFGMKDQNAPIVLDLKTRKFTWPSDYQTVAIVGDSYSQELTFEVPAEFEGVPLNGTSCILSYWTSWTSDEGIHSR